MVWIWGKQDENYAEPVLYLKAENPFAKGGNRLCFVHPDKPDLCVKVRRPDFTLEDLRRKKGFPKNLRPLSSFDDNLEEYNVINDLAGKTGEILFSHVTRCNGFEETDLGPGLVCELLRDATGPISFSVKQYLLEQGRTADFDEAAKTFGEFWTANAVPSRNLLLHNVVAQRDEQGKVRRLVVIDGLGSATFLPVQWLPQKSRQARSAKKIADFNARVEQLMADIRDGNKITDRGKLLHDGT